MKTSAETPKGERLFRCGNELVKMNLDICKIGKNSSGAANSNRHYKIPGQLQSTTFAKVLMENFARSADFELACPLGARNYTLRRFS